MSGQRRVVLHIGAHKTGSTSIQRFLSSHPAYLAAHGCRYFTGAYIADNHVELHLAAMRPERDSTARLQLARRDGVAFDEGFTRGVARRVQDFLATCPGQRVIFSAEGLSLLRHEDELDRLRSILGPYGAATEVILFLRRKQDYLAALRREGRKLGQAFPREQREALEEGVHSWLADYETLVRRYRDAFGRAGVTVLDYDQAVEEWGNVIPAFLRALSLPLAAEIDVGYFRNRTLAGERARTSPATAKLAGGKAAGSDGKHASAPARRRPRPSAATAVERAVTPAVVEQVAASAAGLAGARVDATVRPFAARGGRTVLEFTLGESHRLFAKRYPDPAEAEAAWMLLGYLRDHGFGSDSVHRVPEPLGCFPDWGVVVMRAAAGRPLPAFTSTPGPWEDGLRAAAAWLARLHELPLRLGPRDDVAQGAFALARRASRAVAARPELAEDVARMMGELAARAPADGRDRRPVQTHGRFHAAHVYLAPDSVTVIDLDCRALADPAKDVGEFLHRLRALARRRALDEAASDCATAAFLSEYAGRAGDVPAGLLYYWSYSILATILRLVALERPRWQRRVDFYRAEFEAVPLRVAALG